MDLFEFCSDTLKGGEEVIARQAAVRLYNGEERYKARYELGTVTLTTHRLLWRNVALNVGLDLSQAVLIEKEISRGFSAAFQNKTPKIVIHVSKQSNKTAHSPFAMSGMSFFKLGFTEGGTEEMFRFMEQVLAEKRWNRPLLPSTGGKYRAGIVGIERQLEKQARDTEKNISEAFQDLNSLIEMAKPMVQLVTTISNKMKEKQGSITDDETVIFRQQLLSLGIKDPVTKAKFGSGNVYFEKLAVEISTALENHVKECGGIMSLVEAFCRVNRARGVELLSPEDMMNGCCMLEKLGLPLALREFGSQVKVLQHESFDDDTCIAVTVSLVEQHISLTPEEHARIAGVPFLLAKQSLILSEQRGKLCRDESIEGLRFYPNYILDDFPT